MEKIKSLLLIEAPNILGVKISYKNNLVIFKDHYNYELTYRVNDPYLPHVILEIASWL